MRQFILLEIIKQPVFVSTVNGRGELGGWLLCF